MKLRNIQFALLFAVFFGPNDITGFPLGNMEPQTKASSALMLESESPHGGVDTEVFTPFRSDLTVESQSPHGGVDTEVFTPFRSDLTVDSL